MSFDSDLEIAVVSGELPDFQALRATIEKQLDDDGIHNDVFNSLTEAFLKSRSHFRVHPVYLLQLLDEIAPLFPGLGFDARGLGEWFRETWIAEYRDGQRVYTQGPWDEE
jgi:hypothetical protein